MQRSSSHVLDGVRILRASKVINESHELPTRLVDGKSHMESHHSDRQIWAQYQQLQAKLIMPQARSPVKALLNGLFCRVDWGKWKGVGMMGQATRTYWMRRRLSEDNERRKGKRELIATNLRKQASRGLLRIQPNSLTTLLNQVSTTRGAGRITLDAHRARRRA